MRVGSLFGFALGGQIQSQCELDCLGNHKHCVVLGLSALVSLFSQPLKTTQQIDL
ncbi:hypothetical protein BTURTLESOX_856 [bacterium endosymbiont of Bathymodiolus sp. 5 South]|nr:hypothetical protein BTURTLESOX_856 [bacterium endosymbiont of Bathymodiolus sp. 5 South]